mgnify:CR=1 FL=1
MPNACTQCHKDRQNQWAAAEILKRYPEPKHGFQDFTDAFWLADQGDPRAAYPLIQVAANPAESAIARASALSRIARQPTREGMAVAMAALKDASPLVRRAALEVIEQLPPLERRSALPLLSDPSRIVRMQAAHALAPLAADAIARGAEVVSPRGERFTKDNIGERLNLRDFMDTMRGSGMVGGGPPPLSNSDRQAFANVLDRYLARMPDSP